MHLAITLARIVLCICVLSEGRRGIWKLVLLDHAKSVAPEETANLHIQQEARQSQTQDLKAKRESEIT